MKPRARIVLAISFALLSTSTIVTCATIPRGGPQSEQLDKLKKFETKFNHTINEAIRSPDGSTFASEICSSSFVDHHIQNVADAGTAVCEFSTATKQELRAAVENWIDRIYLSDSGVDPMPDASIDNAWFTMRVDTNAVGGLGTSTGGDGG
jgi:hypothetical protein